MKIKMYLMATMLVSSGALAATDHYLLQDGSHVQHLKINTVGDETMVTVDVDFEPNASEIGEHACSATISGEATAVAENEWLLRRRADGEAHYCNLAIELTDNGATIEQSEDCSYFVTGICHFSSDDGKEFVKIE
jgi:hypothetical protein